MIDVVETMEEVAEESNHNPAPAQAREHRNDGLFESSGRALETEPATEEDLPAPPHKHVIPTHPRLFLRPDFKSVVLPGERDIIVYLPEGYDKTDRRYPVMYLHDGQNLFDGKTSYIPGRTWGVHDAADALIASGKVEPLIIVGIYNAGVARIDEYTPTSTVRIGGGKADLYGRMLIEEVMPLIDKTFRTLKDPANTGLGGSSLGGLVTLYLGLLHPDVFGKLAVLSPSVWWDHKIILSFVRAASPKPDLKIWLDMGTSEGKKFLKDSDLLHNLLVDQGWKDGEDLLYSRIQGGTHDEAAWAQRVAPLLEFLFPGER